MTSRFLISAPHSGAGKTTITLGLLRAFRRKGYAVQPFKCGPDFIDPIHHRTAASRDSINLDRYMMGDGHIRELFAAYTSAADLAVVEGVMGLYDGAVKSEGSAADLSKLLELPVILVLDAKAMGYSAVAILYGLRQFDPGLCVAGVIFNFVGSEGHYELLRQAAADAGVTALGYLPDQPAIRIPSRHLGLDTGEAEAAIEAAAEEVEKYVDLDELLRITGSTGRPRQAASQPRSPDKVPEVPAGQLRILIAKDAAFHFLYPENIRRLEDLGAIHYFSPLTDRHFLTRPDLIYLPGGYPELYLPELSANTPLLEALRSYVAEGGKVLAECGGMMYLGQSITDGSGTVYEMAGVIDARTSIRQQRLTLGYRSVTLPGGIAKGHEFHFSQYSGPPPPGIVKAVNARGEEVILPICCSPGILASYMHFYWGEDRKFLDHWLAS